MPKDSNRRTRKLDKTDLKNPYHKGRKEGDEVTDNTGYDTSLGWREKRTIKNEPSSGLESTTQESRQGSVGGVDSGGTGEISSRPFKHNNNEWTWCFEKSHDFFTHSWAKRVIQKGTGDNIRTYMSTSMAFVPVEFPWLYAMPSEWNQLPEESYVTHAEIDLYYYYGRTSFETNASTASTATANNQLWLNFDADCLKHPGIACQNIGDAGQPVLTTDIESVTHGMYADFTNELYGYADVTSATANPPAIAGTWTEWPFYYAYGLSSYADNGTSSKTAGWPNMKGWYDRVIAKNNENTHMFHRTIHFGENLVTSQRKYNKWAPPGIPNTHRIFMHKDKFMNNGLIDIDAAGKFFEQVPSISQRASLYVGQKDYNASMWNPNKFGFKPGHVNVSSDPPPCFAFGLEEIPAMTAANDKMQYQEGQGFWRLDVKLHGKSKWHTTNMYETTKPYTQNIYSYDASPMLVPEDHGQGTIYGRYWQ